MICLKRTSEHIKQAYTIPSLASSQSCSLVTTDYDLLTPTSSWSSTYTALGETPQGVIGGPGRTDKLTALKLYAVEPVHDLVAPTSARSQPLAIPGAAVVPAQLPVLQPAKPEAREVAKLTAGQAYISSSWAERKQYFPLDDLTKQPPNQAPKRPVKQTVPQATAKGSRLHATGNCTDKAAGQEACAVDMAWRYRFKRKWIREKHFALRRDFPEGDPGYNDPWQEAMGFISALGPGGVLQAAFLNTSIKATATASSISGDTDDELFGEDAEGMLFEEGESGEAEEPLRPSFDNLALKTAGMAAQLVRMQREARNS